ncbi:hypothetical protein TNIN_479241 [Trichonephila inaurata madagascariensis]|uniref:Uncharacterized protein n=1 Tax=Trichonephila inaurata madagascariensis TaxID=2747483 RepID=A0A8X7C5K3_9ARAC|nr:hypothetical protein TNIN_479241 [Trichonephila inaurata madagascariensis]
MLWMTRTSSKWTERAVYQVAVYLLTSRCTADSRFTTVKKEASRLVIADNWSCLSSNRFEKLHPLAYGGLAKELRKNGSSLFPSHFHFWSSWKNWVRKSTELSISQLLIWTRCA